MVDQRNRDVVERKWRACSKPADLSELGSVYHDDAIVQWPQSGERIVGKDNILEVHSNYPGGGPRITVRRILGADDLWFTEQHADYGEQIFHGSAVFELRDGRIARETTYFGEPFEPPEWRARWVERP